MKVALILSGAIKYAPYLKYYTTVLDENSIQYDVISWDRTGATSNEHTFSRKQSDSSSIASRFLKLFTFNAYKNFIIKTIASNNYDAVVAFTIPIGLQLYSYFVKNKINYILDVRDHSFLVKVFPKKMKKLTSNSILNVVSSRGFVDFLKCECVLCHNVSVSDISKNSLDKKRNTKASIDLSSIGSFLEDKINIRLVNALKGCNEMRLCYIGQETKQKIKLIKYVKKHKVKNVLFKGKYLPEETSNLFSKYCDFVNIIRDDNMINRWALPNKLYSGVLLGKPIITNSSNRALKYYIDKFKLGVCFDEPFKSALLLDSIKKFNYDSFYAGREYFLDEVINDQLFFGKKLIKSLNGYGKNIKNKRK